MQETQVWFLGPEDPLEEEMATYSSILAWIIPWAWEPGGLQSMGLRRVGHDWAIDTYIDYSIQMQQLLKCTRTILNSQPIFWDISLRKFKKIEIVKYLLWPRDMKLHLQEESWKNHKYVETKQYVTEQLFDQWRSEMRIKKYLRTKGNESAI